MSEPIEGPRPVRATQPSSGSAPWLERNGGPPEGLGRPIDFARRLATGLEASVDLPEAIERAGAVLPRPARQAAERAARRLRGDNLQDEWGFDEDFVELVYPFLELMYEWWWRVTTTGVMNLPAHGRGLVVANHAGVLPWDAAMMSVGILKEHPLPRYPRFTVLDWAFRLPYVSSMIRMVGGVLASPYNAIRLLEQEHLLMVFPEGSKGAGKPFSERYRLQRFGRGGYVELALRTSSPIIPVAVVGSEEIYPKIFDSRLLARLIGAPYFPITPTFPLLGWLGTIPLPSRWRIEFCPPLDTSKYGPEGAEDPALVLELSEQVRQTIQDKVYENLVLRGNAFL